VDQILLAYKSGARSNNDHFRHMHTLAARLSDEEIRELAGHFATTKPCCGPAFVGVGAD
jgi:cytochrome c553